MPVKYLFLARDGSEGHDYCVPSLQQAAYKARIPDSDMTVAGPAPSQKQCLQKLNKYVGRERIGL